MDYYSNFIELDHLSHTFFQTVICKLRCILCIIAYLTLSFQTTVRDIHLQSFEDLQQHGTSSMSLPYPTTLKLTGLQKVPLKHVNNEESSTFQVWSLPWFIGSLQHPYCHNKHAKQLSELQPGDIVCVRLPCETQWSQAVVSNKIAPHSYKVEANVRVYRQNRKQHTKEEV